MNKMYQIDQDLKDKLVKYFASIEEMADELTTGNTRKQPSRGLLEGQKSF